MKTFKQFTLITLALISFNGVANQSLKTVNSEALLNSYIQNIESKFIGKQINKTTKILFVLTIASIGLFLYYLNQNLLQFDYVLYYALLLIIGPLLYFVIKIISAKTKKEFHHAIELFYRI